MIEIRTPREAEIEAIVRLWNETKRDTYDFIPQEQGRTIDEDRAFFREAIRPRCALWIAAEDTQILGFLALRDSYVDRLYVHPAAQRRGVGGDLLRHAIALSPAGIELHTHVKNAKARAFYEKHGLIAVKFGVSPPPESEPDIEYHWRPVQATFELYEALLWEPPDGYFLLEEHLSRLGRSASHFRFAFDLESARDALLAFRSSLPSSPRKVRLELSADGAIALEHVDRKPSTPVLAALAATPVDSADEFLRHKTSRRGVYERALASRPEAQDVLLWNERRELTESCASNLVVELDGRRLTPAVSCGLLPGTFRCHLLERGEIEEAVLPVDALARATGLYLVNSVRRWCEVRLFDGSRSAS